MELNEKINKHFEGRVVKKELSKEIKGNAVVPTYVLEYLLGQYCATSDHELMKEGVQKVKDIIKNHFVHRDEAQLIKSTIKEKGKHKLIDKVSVRLNDLKGVYEAEFANIGIKKALVDSDTIKKHPKLLSSGVWCITNMAYFLSEEKGVSPWIIESIKPIQISNVDLDEYKESRKNFTKEEWINLLMQSIGLNPEFFNHRSKIIQLTRLIPFTENNYNFFELGPKGTGKSHIFSEMSPHGILVSGGDVTQAKLFVNNSTGDIGLVGYWDVVSFDEFAGRNKSVDKKLVDIMKNYLANKSFSRGANVYGASASMAFIGNTDKSVPHMIKHEDLFIALPKGYYDTAFLDRLHAYIPGWEVKKLRNEVFTSAYGFIVDYLAEILRELRKEDFTTSYKQYFQLSDSITTRDKDGISKTFSGLFKILYPDGNCTKEDKQELLEFAIESRKRVKDQLIKMDETFEEVDFCYKEVNSDKWVFVETLEDETYGTKKKRTEEKEESIALEEKTTNSEPETPKEGQTIIRDNQIGISYNNLFRNHLKGATKIKLIDPYIRYPYQFKNLLEFCSLLHSIKSEDQEISFNLTTWNSEEFIESSRETLEEIQESLIELGINFNFEFSDAHDRHLITDHGWKIILGRGLDIFEKSDSRFSLSEINQELRQCKACEVTFIKL